MRLLVTGCLLFALLTCSGPLRAQEKDDEPLELGRLGKLALALDAGGHSPDIANLCFTRGGKELVTFASDHIRVWDVGTGQTRKVIRLPGFYWPNTPVVSPDGMTLAIAARPEPKNVASRIYLLSTADWQIQRTFEMPASATKPDAPGGYGPVLAFSPDGKQLAAGHRLTRIWDLTKDSSEPRQEFKQGGEVQSLAFSPDGRRLLDYPLLNVRDLDTGKRQMLHKSGAMSAPWRTTILAYSPDGKTIAVGSGDGLWLHEPDGTLRARVFKGNQVPAVAFSPDSRHVLAVGIRGAQVVDVASPDKVVDLKRKDGFYKGVLSPDGKVAALVRYNFVVLVDASSGETLLRLPGPRWLKGQPRATWTEDGTAVSWSPLVKGKDTLPKDARTFNFMKLAFEPPTGPRHGAVLEFGPVSIQRVPGTGRFEVRKDGQVLTNLTTPKGFAPNRVTLLGSDRAVLLTQLGIAPGGNFLFDSQTGKLVAQLSGGVFLSMAPSPDGRFLMTLTNDQVLRVREAKEGKVLLSMFMNGEDWIVWTPEGYYAATPGGERLMGWTLDTGMDKLPTYYPAERFRKQLHRPDVIKLVLQKGSVKAALETANAALKAEGVTVREGIADPNKMLPPVATLEILDKTALPKLKVRASAKPTVKEQPVTALRLFVDGRPLPDRQASTDKSEATWEIELPPGKHTLSVFAKSPDSSSVSNSIEVSFNRKDDLPVLHVLAIGVSKYQEQNLKLDFAAKDAKDLLAAFEAAGKGELYGGVKTRPLLDGDATAANIVNEMAALRKRAKPNDLVIVFFAGHGVKEKDKFYLLPVDTKSKALAKTAVSGDALRKNLGEFPCQVLLMLDACHSSAGVKAFRPAVDDLTRTLTDDECGVAVLCAAMAHEKAAEKYGNGVFTRALIEGLRRTDKVPYNFRDKRQYIHHLFAFVFDEVKAESDDRQHPFLSLPWIVESFAIRQVMVARQVKQ